MPRVRLSFLGPPLIEVDGSGVQLDTRKAIALLAYLSVTGGDVSRDPVANLLWSRYGRTGGHAALRRTLSTIRTVLGHEFLRAKRDTVGLAASADVWVDVSRMRECQTLCERHSHAPHDLCRDCLPLLTEAANLLRGDFLGGFTLRDSIEFDDWQFLQTERFR
jgi:DNA-binding SARP family transcriptional activator